MNSRSCPGASAALARALDGRSEAAMAQIDGVLAETA